MNIRPIHTDADHRATLKEISALMERDPERGTPDGDRLDILVTLVQAHEAQRLHQGLGIPAEVLIAETPIDA